MTGLEQLDLMARGGSIALLALWGWILIRDHRDQLAAKLAIAKAWFNDETHSGAAIWRWWDWPRSTAS